MKDHLPSKCKESLEFSTEQRYGVLFDNHIGNEQAFHFCEQNNYGFTDA